MLTSRRDYLLRLIDEVGRLLARAIMKRQASAPHDALDAIVHSCERLFGLEADQLFQFTPEQHFAMLIDGEPPEMARDKVLLYASLNAEAGKNYLLIGRTEMARASTLNALRLSLRARLEFPAGNLPIYAPDIAELRAALAGAPLDADTEALLKAAEGRCGEPKAEP